MFLVLTKRKGTRYPAVQVVFFIDLFFGEREARLQARGARSCRFNKSVREDFLEEKERAPGLKNL